MSFIPSADHDAVTSDGQPVVLGYDLEIFVAGEYEPLVSISLRKPDRAPDGRIYINFAPLLGSPPVAGAVLEARVTAIALSGRAESGPSNHFQFDSASGLPPLVPSVRITAPSRGATIKPGQTITLAALVRGNAIGVDFYANGTFIGTATQNPFRVRWSSQSNGRFAITAVTVANGIQVKSPPAIVMVTPVASVARGKPPGAVSTAVARSRQ